MEKLKIQGRKQVQPPIPISVTRWHDGVGRGDLLSPRVKLFAMGWQAALQRSGHVHLETSDWQTASPRVVSIPLDASRPRCRGFRFSPDASWQQTAPAAAAAESPPAEPATRPSRRPATRIRPPGDLVKLQDRLYYLLQPPLETLFSSSALRFPFEPFPFQFEGVAFLYPRYAAILADEMGLGKTMQAITTIRMLLRSGELSRVLIVCPKPLVTNWVREFGAWAAEVPVAVIEGNQVRRSWQWQQPVPPVQVANYELLVRDREILESAETHFDLVVLDEAQRIKNRLSTTSEVARGISRSRSWALTGTPIENSLDDLVGIFEFLSPGHLHTEMSAQQMATRVSDYILRRTKEMVLTDLPPRLYRDAELSLSDDQLASYQVAEEDGVVRLEGMGKEITIHHVFQLILRLKQICNFDPVSGASSKLDRLEADLEEVAASGKKAIIFSQWVKTLERLREKLARFMPLEYHGKVPSRKRDGVIEQFRQDPRHQVMLMSYGAGSVGLNLQFCEYVFLFDRWWNPAVEDQAINRAHRIGVAGPVTVTRMLCLGTIEERIQQVLIEKRRLFDAILDRTSDPEPSRLSQQDIFGLFDLKIPSKGKGDRKKD
jgi:SNF2 family DNA or RNA helicase